MKKLIAISVMCVLVLGAAFAETTVGGKIHIGGQILNGTSVEGSTPGTQEMDSDWYNTAVAVNFGDAAAGGKLSIHNFNPSFYDYWVWWRPAQLFKMQLGVNADGSFGTSQITGWGFTAEAKNRLGAINEYSGPVFGLAHARTGFYGGTGETKHIGFSLYPVEGLTVNLWVPLGSNAVLSFAKTNLNVAYQIEGIGTAFLSFESNTGYVKGDDNPTAPVYDADGNITGGRYAWQGENGITDPGSSPKAYLSFFLTAVEGMAFDLGVAYKFPFTNPDQEYSVKDDTGGKVDVVRSTTTYHPLEIGLGYRIGLGDFTFKIRAAATLIGKTTIAAIEDAALGVNEAEETTNADTQISVNINPSLKVAGMTVYFFAGIGIQINEIPKDSKGEVVKTSQRYINDSEALISWFVNPYVEIPAGDLRFQVGLQVYSDGNQFLRRSDEVRDPAVINWAIPVGFRAYF